MQRKSYHTRFCSDFHERNVHGDEDEEKIEEEKEDLEEKDDENEAGGRVKGDGERKLHS